MSHKTLVLELTKAGFLKDWTKHLCPHCGTGSVQPLTKRQSGVWAYRCKKKGCQHFILPHMCHPVFSTAKGKSFKSLKEQTKLHFGLVLDLTAQQNHLLWQCDAKFVSSLFKKLDLIRQKYVIKLERQIKFGDPQGKECMDIEASEVDLGKELVQDGEQAKARWDQWAGIVERGRPGSLVLFKTKPKLTKTRATGPGPIKKRDWKPMASKWLKGRRVFLHTDGARSYKIGVNRKDHMPGIMHDYVVHKPKKRIGGKPMRAKYVQFFSHQMDGNVVYTKGGTQIIDRCWRHIREHVGTRSSSSSGIRLFEARVRSAQWMYWKRGQDLWMETGQMLKSTL